MRLFGTLAALAVLAGVLVWALDPHYAQQRADRAAYERARQELDLQARAFEQNLSQAEALATQPARITLSYGLAALALVALGGALAIAGDAYRQRRLPVVRPDHAGRLPVGRTVVIEHPALSAHTYDLAAAVEVARAVHTPGQLPAHMHITAPAAPSAAQLPPPTAPKVEVPTVEQLLTTGRLNASGPILFGYDRDHGTPVTGQWLDLYSTAIGGLTGSGKTWTAVYLAAQAALRSGRLVVIDPHGEHPESLSARLAPLGAALVCAPATEPVAMLNAVELVVAELDRRRRGQRGAPWIVLIDEFSALQRGDLAAPLGRMVEALSQEGRKLGLYALVSGQAWTATRAGGTELRDCLASAFMHRLRPAQARMLSGLRADDLPGDLLDLPPGAAYLLTTSGDLRAVMIPRMTPADVERVATLLPAPRTAEGAPEGMAEGTIDTPLPGRQHAVQWSADEARIVAALAAGRKPGELAEELAGARGGRKYQEAAATVAAVIARLAQNR